MEKAKFTSLRSPSVGKNRKELRDNQTRGVPRRCPGHRQGKVPDGYRDRDCDLIGNNRTWLSDLSNWPPHICALAVDIIIVEMLGNHFDLGTRVLKE